MKENLQLAKRLNELIEKKKISPYSLAKSIGVSHVAVGDWLKGGMPKSEYIVSLASYFGVSTDWLLTGSETQYPPHADGSLQLIDQTTPKNYGGPYWGMSTMAPIVSAAAAGIGREFLDAEHAAPMINVNCKDPNCYCLIVWGHSMEPIYQPGDILVVAPGLEVQPNDLVVFKSSDDEPFFKKWLGMKSGNHRFASLNPNFELMIKEPEEIKKLHPVHSVIRPLKGKIF